TATQEGVDQTIAPRTGAGASPPFVSEIKINELTGRIRTTCIICSSKCALTTRLPHSEHNLIRFARVVRPNPQARANASNIELQKMLMVDCGHNNGPGRRFEHTIESRAIITSNVRYRTNCHRGRTVLLHQTTKGNAGRRRPYRFAACNRGSLPSRNIRY